MKSKETDGGDNVWGRQKDDREGMGNGESNNELPFEKTLFW